MCDLLPPAHFDASLPSAHIIGAGLPFLLDAETTADPRPAAFDGGSYSPGLVFFVADAAFVCGGAID